MALLRRLTGRQLRSPTPLPNIITVGNPPFPLRSFFGRAERHLAQLATGNPNNNNGGDGNGDPRSKLKDFQSTNPPIFSKCTEPLDADDWLRTIENNLEVVGVGINEEVLFATHYLSGPARAWWENVKDIQAEGHVISWEEFKIKFRKTHIPSGLIKLMKDKFMNLRQGSMSVVDYDTSPTYR
ncbi:hypothetical protein QYE76_066360 [Lolium multiflorum]|uniref:Retrotransposon gag domain-containing protein n=1 Tax=Lolium multiflorum TaxID=4521 RepID=A0AAD8SCR4_LOLMU|nr:hypothetical protein QYE76_066360 [Lolium multiflorum]